MTVLKSYQELEVWKKSIDLSEMVYRTSADFPSEAKFGMTGLVRVRLFRRQPISPRARNAMGPQNSFSFWG